MVKSLYQKLPIMLYGSVSQTFLKWGPLFNVRDTVLYHIVLWLSVRIHFAEGGKMFIKKHGASRPRSASDVVHVNAIRALLEEHHCWTCIELARKVGIATGTILHILKKKLKMRKFCARWFHTILKRKTCGREWKQ